MSTGLRALPFVLAFTTCSTYVFATPDQSDLTRSTCYEIRSGDTAARLAQRFTGNEFNRYQAWFQIVDPATGAFIPKSRYRLIQSGWYVCVATEMLRFRSTPVGYFAVSTAPLAVQQIPVSQNAVFDTRKLWWSAPFFVFIAGLLLAWSWKHIDERQARRDLMRGFGTKFISEFERPLLRNATAQPLKARLRISPARRKMDIFLAPGIGRSYPNLVDHKRNVEYDVARVMRVLRHEPFISGPLYEEGRWVVIPCRLEGGRQREGVQ